MWNHNSHFHDYLLSQLPLTINRALDIGCGLGMFASKLAERAKIVDALDLDPKIIEEASRIQNASNVYYRCADFITTELPKDSYDVAVFIASIHHMDLAIALNKIKLLLRPSGKLLVLGLYKETTKQF